MELKTHQIICKNKIATHFQNENKGLIKMFCGSGKSFIIYDTLLTYGTNLSVVVVPSINLITQFNRDYLLRTDLQNNRDYDILTICSKNELDKESKLQITTEPEEILDFLELDNEKIILVTYQSLKTLVDIFI